MNTYTVQFQMCLEDYGGEKMLRLKLGKFKKGFSTWSCPLDGQIL